MAREKTICHQKIKRTHTLNFKPGTNERRAKHFGLSAEQVHDLMAGKVDKFRLSELEAIARKVGVAAKV